MPADYYSNLLSNSMQKAGDFLLQSLLIDFWPKYRAPIITWVIASILVAVVKIFGQSIIRWISAISGDSRRETRWKVRKFNSVYDFVTNFQDLLKRLQFHK